MKPLQYGAMIASVILILPATAFGATGTTPPMQNAMNKVTCDTTMLEGFVNDVLGKIPSATSLSQGLSTVNYDAQQLANYAKNNDKTNFDSYLKNTYQKDVKSLRHTIQNLIKTSSVDKDVKDGIKTLLDMRQSENQKCISGVLKTIEEVKNQKSANQIPAKDLTKVILSKTKKPNQK